MYVYSSMYPYAQKTLCIIETMAENFVCDYMSMA